MKPTFDRPDQPPNPSNSALSSSVSTPAISSSQPTTAPPTAPTHPLLQLLLRPQLVRMATLLLAACNPSAVLAFQSRGRRPTNSSLVAGDGRSLDSAPGISFSSRHGWDRGEVWEGEGGGAVHFRQIILSQLYLEARALREGSMIPPRRRRTRWRVDSWCVRGVSGVSRGLHG